jgi:hypothetical protein
MQQNHSPHHRPDNIQAAVSFDGQEWAWMPPAVTCYTTFHFPKNKSKKEKRRA